MKKLTVILMSSVFVFSTLSIASAAKTGPATIAGHVDYYGVQADNATVKLTKAFKGFQKKYRTTTTNVFGEYQLQDLDGIKAITQGQMGKVKAVWFDELYGGCLSVKFSGTTDLPLGSQSPGAAVNIGGGDADITLEFVSATVMCP